VQRDQWVKTGGIDLVVANLLSNAFDEPVIGLDLDLAIARRYPDAMVVVKGKR
jgi:hypothetical protein